MKKQNFGGEGVECILWTGVFFFINSILTWDSIWRNSWRVGAMYRWYIHFSKLQLLLNIWAFFMTVLHVLWYLLSIKLSQSKKKMVLEFVISWIRKSLSHLHKLMIRRGMAPYVSIYNPSYPNQLPPYLLLTGSRNLCMTVLEPSYYRLSL